MGEPNVHITAAPSAPLSMYAERSRVREIRARSGKVIRSPPERVLIEVSARCPDGEERSYKCESEEDEAERHVSIRLGSKQDVELK